MIDPEDVIGPERAEWYLMTPQERWDASARLWADYLVLGGDLDRDSENDQPVFDPEKRSQAMQRMTKLASFGGTSRMNADLLAIATRLSDLVTNLDVRTDQCELVRIYLRGKHTIVTIEGRNGRYEARALLITPEDLAPNRPCGYCTFNGIGEIDRVAAWLRGIVAACE